LRARGTALCPHYEASENHVRRFIGRRVDRTIGHDEVNPENGQTVKTGGFPSTGEAEEVPYRAEYLFAVRDGDAWAADEETAKVCGVPFDPTFGGEIAVVPPDTTPAPAPEPAKPGLVSLPAASAHHEIEDAAHDPTTTA
jgi:hypothetical protein